MFKRIKQFFNLGGELDMNGWFDQMQTDLHGLPYVQNTVPMPKVKPCRVENCTFTNNNTIEGLKLALKHSTKYEDRMFLQFLIKVARRAERNGGKHDS